MFPVISLVVIIFVSIFFFSEIGLVSKKFDLPLRSSGYTKERGASVVPENFKNELGKCDV